ncbi:hypothetical protein TNCV_4429341 [Trichonephila clavipes]|nr:hypothetical protein TNCV_4429341 [Trichonephila clavipes]
MKAIRCEPLDVCQESLFPNEMPSVTRFSAAATHIALQQPLRMIGSASLSSSYVRSVGRLGIPRRVKGCRGETKKRPRNILRVQMLLHVVIISTKEANSQLCGGKRHIVIARYP